MADRLYANNYSDTLNGGITAVATSITVNDASPLPALAGGDTLNLTMDDGTNIEIVQVTGIAANVLTVVRAQEGTTGFAFSDADLIELRLTEGSLEANGHPHAAEDIAGGAYSGAHDFGGADSLEIPNGAAPTVNAAGEIAVDTTITDYTGMIKYYDGTEELTVAAMPTANYTTVDGDIIKYNAANNELEMFTPAASQAQMEAASVSSVYVTPLVAQNHPGACKAWGRVTVSTATAVVDYNVTSYTDNAVGDFTITWDTDFQGQNVYCIVVSCEAVAAGFFAVADTFASGGASCDVNLYSDTSTLADPTRFHFAAFGDQ